MSNRKRANKAPTQITHVKWPPLDTTLYQQQLTTKLEDLVITTQLELKCDQIEAAIKEALRDQQTHTTTPTSKHIRPTSENLTRLIDDRRTTTSRDTATRSCLSKQIRKEVRAIRRATRHAEIDTILEEYRDLQKVSGIKSRKRRELIPSMLDTDGQQQNDRQSVGDVLATFYEQLYKNIDTGSTTHHDTHTTTTTTTTRLTTTYHLSQR